MLTSFTLCIAALDTVWASLQEFNVNLRDYSLLAFLSASLAVGGLIYLRFRPEPNLSAMLFGGSFLVGFSAAASILNYFLLTVAGSRIDAALAQADRAIGVDWPRWMAWFADHPTVNAVLVVAYQLTLPQIALVVVALGLTSRGANIYKLCIAIAISALLTIAIWTITPSFGAFSVYVLPIDVSARLTLVLDGLYADELVRLLAEGPGEISPTAVKGLIGFPSFHATLALIAAWYARPFRYLGSLVILVTALVLIATPIQGGHHVIDVIAAIAVTAFSILVSAALSAWCKHRMV